MSLRGSCHFPSRGTMIVTQILSAPRIIFDILHHARNLFRKLREKNEESIYDGPNNRYIYVSLERRSTFLSNYILVRRGYYSQDSANNIWNFASLDTKLLPEATARSEIEDHETPSNEMHMYLLTGKLSGSIISARDGLHRRARSKRWISVSLYEVSSGCPVPDDERRWGSSSGLLRFR